MHQEIDEKPRVTTHDEAPARNLVSAVLNAASKQNGGRSLHPESQSMVLLQQQVNQMGSITGTAAPPTSIAGLTGSLAQTSPSGLGGEYVGSLYHHVGQENPDTEVESTYDEGIRDREELREQDRFLPIANVARIMKKGIPETGKIAKDAKECVQECVSEFISFITSEASERCQQEKRKTINGEDILFAMTTLGFDNYVEPLKVYLTKYRESLKGEKVLNVSEYPQTVDGEDGSSAMQHTLQYQVGNALHPSMVSADGTYAYTQAQVSQKQYEGYCLKKG